MSRTNGLTGRTRHRSYCQMTGRTKVPFFVSEFGGCRRDQSEIKGDFQMMLRQDIKESV